MKNLSIAFLAAVSLMSFGCGGKKKGDAMGKMTEYKDLMCKCTDKACADKVSADYAKAMADMAAGEKEVKAPDPEEAKKYAPIMKEYTDCMMKASGMGGAMGGAAGGDKPAPTGDKPAEPAAPPAAPPGDKPAEPPAAPPADKPAGGSN